MRTLRVSLLALSALLGCGHSSSGANLDAGGQQLSDVGGAPTSIDATDDAGKKTHDAGGPDVARSDAGSGADATDSSDGSLGEGGEAGDAATPDPCTSAATTPTGYKSVYDFGMTIHGDGTTADGPTLQSIVNANPSAKLCFPPGKYLLLNDGLSSLGLNFLNFTGAVLMSKEAAFVCDNVTAEAGQCLNVQNATNVTFENVTVTFGNTSALPLPRGACSPNNAILVIQSSGVTLTNTTINYSPGVGIWVTNSENVTVNHTYVTETSADGLHFENTKNAVIDDFTTLVTGDDGLADTCIAQTNPNCGFTATNIHIHTSLARGIVVVGGCNANISNFDIAGTHDPGISTSQDETIMSRRPTMVNFSTGTITGGEYCGEIAAADGVVYDTITCTGPTNDGFQIYGSATEATIENSQVTTSGNVGFQAVSSSTVSFLHDTVTGSVSSGFAIQGCTGVTLTSDTTDQAGAYGFYHSMSTQVTEQMLVAKDSSTTSGNRRAWWAENMTGAITASGLQVIDDQAVATGYVVGDVSNGTNPVTVTDLSFMLAHGTQSVQPGGATSTYMVVP